MHMSYWRFAAMIATSTLVMFELMYLNTYALEHIFWSETRAWMALLMGATMAIIMLSFMLSMYKNSRINMAIFLGSAVVFGLALFLVRSQASIDETEYMKAMIPHHSIAIMTSERAQMEDPRVRKLAEEIVAAQRREIAEMKYLIEDIESGDGDGARGSGVNSGPAQVTAAADAIERPEIAKADPASIGATEIDMVLPPGPGCQFSYTQESKPILVGRVGDEGALGMTKVHGRLVELQLEGEPDFEALVAGQSFTADGIKMVVTPVPEHEPEETTNGQRMPADLRFELEQGLSVDYRGWYTCADR